MYRLFMGIAEDEAQVDRFLEEYAGKFAASSKLEITSRDLEFIHQGLKMAGRRMGDRIIQPVQEGFMRGYRG